jgi:signal transduction histidine kinase/CheY-like chemotaxis protein
MHQDALHVVVIQEDSLLLSPDVAGRREHVVAMGAILCSAALFLAALPFVSTRLPAAPLFIPAYESALLIFDLVTAVFLFGRFVVFRSWALYVLACGYVFTAAIEVAHTLTFPGVFSATGLLGAGPQSTGWLYVFWHGGFPPFVIAYAVLGESRGKRGAPPSGPAPEKRFDARTAIVMGVAAMVALVCALTLLATSGASLLPVLLVGNTSTPMVARAVSVGGLFGLVALVLLSRRGRSTVLDLWLKVVMWTWLFDVGLSAFFSTNRFDLGWYLGRIYGLLAAAFLLIYLLVESLKQHASLVLVSQALSAANAGLEERIASRTAELVLAREAAESADRAKSAFLATMSHEIRTPMNGVVGMAEVLFHSELPADMVDPVATIRTSGFALLGIIDEVLDFSKIEAGQLEIERVVVALPELIESVCSTLLPMAMERDVELSLFISPLVPAQIWSDPTRLRQVLFNLAGNAIKFSAGEPKRRGRVSVRVHVEGNSPTLVMRVVDNGIGMAPEVQARLFTPFMQAETSTTRRFGGTGLGLTIIKRLLTLMNGEIGVESELGQGSTFTVTLPLETAAQGGVDAGVDLTGVQCVIVGTGDKVDDLRVYLAHVGAQVEAADSVAAGVERASRLGSPVVVQARWRDTQSPNLLREAFASVVGVRHVLVARGRRRRLEPAPDLVVVDGNCLRRSELVEAVAVSAGRAPAREPSHGESLGRDSDTTEALSVNEARRLGRLILVAEDDEVNQRVIRRQVQMLGYASVVVDNGAEAFRQWQEGRYSLLVTDLHMPEMDGYSLAVAIRDDERTRRIAGDARMPILALTADAQSGEAIRARAAGIDEYLIKPMELRVLKAALRKWLPLERPDTAPSELQDEF